MSDVSDADRSALAEERAALVRLLRSANCLPEKPDWPARAQYHQMADAVIAAGWRPAPGGPAGEAYLKKLLEEVAYVFFGKNPEAEQVVSYGVQAHRRNLRDAEPAPVEATPPPPDEPLDLLAALTKSIEERRDA